MRPAMRVVILGSRKKVDPLGVPSSYFGMHIQSPITQAGLIAWPPISFGAIRLYGRISWKYIEPSLDTYAFTTAYGPTPTAPADQYVNGSASRNVSLIYQWLDTPVWAGGVSGQTWPPSDWTFLTNAVTTLARRYCSPSNFLVQNLEGMNEPNFFQGSVAQVVTWMQTLRAAAKAVNPSINILSPSPTTSGSPVYTPATWIVAYLAAGGDGNQEIMTFHAYQKTPGSEAELVGIISDYKAALVGYSAAALPLWNTEGSWGINSGYTNDDDRAAFTAKYYLLQWGMGVSRVYWYHADDNITGLPSPPSASGYGTLYTSSGLTKAGTAYIQVYQWMLGARAALYSKSGTIWSVAITRPLLSYNALAIWDTAGSTYNVPSIYTQYRDLDGVLHSVVGGQVTLTNKPILLESGSAW